MAIPTLAMIPSGYKLNKVYSVLPTDGSGDLVTARTSTATRVNSDGLIEEVAIGVPRLDYTDGGCPSLLLEPSSTNLITESEAFDNAYWTKSGATVTSGFSAPSVDSPLGAFKLVNTLQTDKDLGLGVTVSANVGSTYTSSIWLKGEGSNIGKSIFIRGKRSSGGPYVGADLTVVLTSEWKRFSTAPLTLVTGNNAYRIILSSNDATDCLIFGAQLEEQSSATSYIPTAGTTISRTADSASKSGISNLIGQTEGVLYAEISALANDGTSRYMSINSGSNANEILYGFSVSGNYLRLRANSLTVFETTISGLDALIYHKFAIKYKSGDWSIYINGSKMDLGNETFSFTSNINELEFSGASGSPFFGKCKDLRIYKSADMTDSELQILTTI